MKRKTSSVAAKKKRPRTSSASAVPTAEELEDKIIALLEDQGKVDQDTLETQFRSLYGKDTDMWNAHLAQSLNNLLRVNRVGMYQNGNVLEYELQSRDLAKKLTGLTTEELQVLQEVRKGKNHGVWIRDLRYNTRLQKNRIEKILKKLTIVGLIKSVKSIASMNRRLYMLKDTVPAREISGGPWYTDSEFDEGFIGSLRTAIEQLIKGNDSKRNHGTDADWAYMSTADIHKQLVAFNLTETHLTVDHIQEIVNTLVYDGQVMEVNKNGTSHSLNATLGDERSQSNRKRFYKMVAHPSAVNSWTNKYGQSYAQDSDYTDGFGRGKMILFCKCGCGMSSGCGIASLSTEAYHARVLTMRREQMDHERSYVKGEM
jgi:predicted transcriptional regulator